MKKSLLLNLSTILISLLVVSEFLATAQTFTDVTTGSGLEKVPVRGRNFIQWADYNNDGLLDLFVVADTVVGEGAATATQKIFRVYKNNGGANYTFTDVSSTVVGGIPGLTASSLAFTDFNNDGFLDFAYAGVTRDGGTLSTKLYKNSGPPNYSYSEVTTAILPASCQGAVLWGDFDKDGLPDLLISGHDVSGLRVNANTRFTKIYKNIDGKFFALAYTFTNQAFGNARSIDFSDVNGDGYPDVTTYNYSNIRTIAINNKIGGFKEWNPITGYGANAVLAGAIRWQDFNNDGKLELLGVLEEASTPYCQNRLLKFNTSANLLTVAPTLSQLGKNWKEQPPAAWGNWNCDLKVADFDNDGLLDFSLNKGGANVSNSDRSVNGWDSVFIYRNERADTITVNGSASPFSKYQVLPVKNAYSYGDTWGDFNNDGKIDIIVPGDSTVHRVYLYKNGVSTINNAPGKPTLLTPVVSGENVTLLWNIAADDKSPRLNYDIRVGTKSGGIDIVSPISDPTSGYRRVSVFSTVYDTTQASRTTMGYLLKNLQAGTYYWSIQGIDGGLKGGAWATEGSFVISSLQASNMVASAMTSTSMTLSWTNGNKAKRAVFMKQGINGMPVLIDTAFTANPVFGSAGSNFRNTGWYCLYNGTGTTVDVTGLTANTSYSAVVVEYDESGPNVLYNLSRAQGNPLITSTYTAPSTQATGITFTGITATQFNVAWTNGNGSTRAVFVYKGNSGSAAPVNQSTYIGNSAFGLGSQIGTSGWFCVYNGTGTNVTVTGLSEKTNYMVMICEYNGIPGLEVYNSTSSINNSGVVQTISAITTQASTIQVFAGSVQFDITWTSGTGQKRAVFMTQGNTGSANITDDQTYTANTTFGQGTSDGNSWYCVYNGTGSSVSVTNLQVNTEYRIIIYEYNGNSGSEKYLTITSEPSGNPLNQKTDSRLQQIITFGTLADKTYGNPSFYLSAKGGDSGNPVVFTSSDVNVVTIVDSTVTIVGAGTVNISANQAANATYAAAAQQVRTLIVNKAPQKVLFTLLPSKTYGDQPFDLSATGGGSGNTITFASDNASIATVSGKTVTVIGAGTAKITASQAGDINYLAAKDSVQTFIVKKAPQSLVFDAIPAKAYFDAPFKVFATASSGLPVVFSSASSNVATVRNDTVTIVMPGTVNIIVSQAGSSNYLAASSAQSLIINKATQTITFLAIPSSFKNTDPDFQLSAISTSGLKVTFISSDLGVAAIQGDMTNDFIHFYGSGNATITAIQIGNDFYAAATPAPQTITVTRATDVLQLTGNEVSVYPNPVSNKVTIALGTLVNDASIGIYSLTGQQITLVKAVDNVTDINVSDLKAGIYLVKIITADGIIVKQIVKQ